MELSEENIIMELKPEPKPEPKPKPVKEKVPLSVQFKVKINKQREKLLKTIYDELGKRNPNWEDILIHREAHEALVKIKSLISTHPPPKK